MRDSTAEVLSGSWTCSPTLSAATEGTGMNEKEETMTNSETTGDGGAATVDGGAATVDAVHFLQLNFTPSMGREPAWNVGETRTVPHPSTVRLCEYGYHSCRTWCDALLYAPGSLACRVRVSPPVASDATKQVSVTRTLVAARDATMTLRTFAADCAERALERERAAGREPDPRSWAAVAAARAFVAGTISAFDLPVAAAYDAARQAEIRWQRQHLNDLMDTLFATEG